MKKKVCPERRIVLQQNARIRTFCQRLMETDEQRAERLRKKRERRALKKFAESVKQRTPKLQQVPQLQTLREPPSGDSQTIFLEKVKMTETTRADRTDTEKVKRRMIRTIGRLLSEKKPEDELWQYMEKEYGKKSRVLWDRMRSLTLKKLKMLFDVNDIVNNVPKVARMTLTDWLIFDLVLVHEKFDVIDMRKIRENKPSDVLSKLFSLVLRFEIEGRVGEDLANAWIAATVHYNSNGHQCSPMLLQRRWYQLTEVTRATFYKFWFIFRGTKRQLAKAMEESPISELQRDIALRYSHIVTEPFQEWEERIKLRTVIMPEEFEMKMRSVNFMRPSDLTVPDLVLVEPKINTIDLCDSDDDDNSEMQVTSDDQSESNTTEPTVTIKSEPIDLKADDDYETELPIETQSDSNFDEEIQRLQLVSNEISIGSDNEAQYDDERDSDDHTNDDDPDMALRKAVESINCTENDTAVVNNDINIETSQVAEDNPSTDITCIQTSTISQDNATNVDNSSNLNTEDHQNIQTDVITNEVIDRTLVENVGETDLVVKVEKDETLTGTTEDALPVISTISSAGVLIDLGHAVEGKTLTSEINMDTDDVSSKNIDQSLAVEIKKENQIVNIENEITEAVDSQSIDQHCSINSHHNDTNEIQIKQEHVRNIEDLETNKDNLTENIEKISDIDETKNKQTVKTEIIEDSSSEDDIIKIVSPSVKKIDEFNFNDVPIDLDFADDGIQLVDHGIEYVESDDDQGEESEDKEPKIDPKLLMCPVVYTTKVDKMSIFKYIPFNEEIQDKAVINQIDFLSKPVSKLALLAEIEIQKEEAKKHSRKVKILPANDESSKVSVTEILNQQLMIKCEPQETTLLEENIEETSEDEEVPRIKPTSYLLRKPLNRSYNPIQLCKNPDFNTRLKRLPVSFYTYPRNRILLHECKPMTIDLSKAFESKLFNGTLYLTNDKTVPCSTPLHVPNDDATTSSIIPSAPPVHSLMDVDKILEEELKKRVIERSRAINLPDITEVRRINQQLLTAEVMPLIKSLENTATTDINMDNNVDIDNSTGNDNFTACNNPTVSDTSTISNNPTDESRDVNVDNAIVIDDDRTLEPQNEILSNNKNNDEDTVTPIPYLEPIIPQKKSVKTKTLVKTTVDERECANSNKNDKSINQARKLYRKNAQPNWLTKPSYPVDNSDLLLTADTLYKMLFAIDPRAVANSTFNKYVNQSLKNNVVLSKQTIFKKKLRKLKEDDKDQGQQTTEQKTKSQSTSTEEQTSSVKAKVNVVYDRSKSVQARNKYCCWARHKIEYIKGNTNRIRKHSPCGEICKCCCAAVLATHLSIENKKVEMYKERQRVELERKKSVMRREIEKRRQEHEILKKACESIESVVQQTKEFKKVGVYTVDTAPVEPVRNLIAVVPDAANKSVPVYLESRDNASKDIVPETPISINYDKPQPSILQKLVEAQTTELKNSPTTKRNSKAGLQWTTCPCNRPILKQSNHGTILVDGTNYCTFHNKNSKESMVNKKGKLYIDRKTSFERPIFIGKNKLLLTNVKEPTQPSEFEKPPLVSAVPAAENIQMPEGVQIILLPNGTLTYTVDPNAKLTENQLSVMPTILAAIQQQINSGNLAMVPTNSAIGDIVQDDIIGFQDTPINYNLAKPSTVETIDLDNNEPNDSIPTTSEVSSREVIKHGTCVTAPKEDELSEATTTKANDSLVSGETEQIDDVMEVDNIQTNQNTENSQTPATETSEGSQPKKNLEIENKAVVVQDTEDKSSDGQQTLQKDRKSLLSDLMEMSGICEEDVAPAPVPTPIPLDPELHLAKTTIFSTKTRLPPIAPKPISNPKSLKDVYADLSTVNSFSELKYAYSNGGLFFKLDLDTGVIVPIALCIKKKDRNVAPSIPESIIDLTDDTDLADDENVTFNTNSTDVAHNIKTTHIFKRVLNEVKSSVGIKQYPRASGTTKQGRPNILVRKRSKATDKSLRKYYIMPKKPAYKPVQIDLDDSDTPMVEEYLDPSSGDESDDEPLAKKARRAAESRQPTSSNIENKLFSLDSTLDIEREGQLALESTLDEEVMPSEMAEQSEVQPGIPKPTHLVLTRDEVHETVPIGTFFQNEGNDSNAHEDCILGV